MKTPDFVNLYIAKKISGGELMEKCSHSEIIGCMAGIIDANNNDIENLKNSLQELISKFIGEAKPLIIQGQKMTRKDIVDSLWELYNETLSLKRKVEGHSSRYPDFELMLDWIDKNGLEQK